MPLHLSGFNTLEPAKKQIVRKMLDNFLRKLDNTNADVHKLALTIKNIHKHQKGQKYEIQGTLTRPGRTSQASFTDFNVFSALDKVLHRIK